MMILDSQENARKITTPSFKLLYKQYSNGARKKRHVDQSSKPEDPNMKTCSDSHLIFEK